ncbi:unnamed protein product, partial [Staurois parvus]
NVSASYGANVKWPVRYFCRHHVRISSRPLSSSLLQDLTCSSLQRCRLPAAASVTAGAALLLYCVRSLWSSPVLCPQSLVISCTVSAVSGHLLYCVRSLWSSVLCPQSLVISCTKSTVSGHLLYCVRSLWSSPVRCPQSLVISCTKSAVSGHLLY